MSGLMWYAAWFYRATGWLLGATFIFRSVWGERSLEQFMTGIGWIVVTKWMYQLAMGFSVEFKNRPLRRAGTVQPKQGPLSPSASAAK